MKSLIDSTLSRVSTIALYATLATSAVVPSLGCGSAGREDVLQLGEVSSAVISKTPVASWSFEETSPDRAFYTGPGAQNGVACAFGPQRFTAKFDGFDDQIVMDDHPSYRFSTAMTVSAWVRPTLTDSTRAIVNKWTSTSAYKLDIADGKYRFSLALTDGSTQSISASAAAPVDAWAHVTATFNGTQMRLYINGTQVATKTLSPTKTIANSTQPIRIGVEGNTANRFIGRIDEVRLYNAALTAAEVKELAGFVPGTSATKTRKVLFAVYDPVLPSNGQKLTKTRGWQDPLAMIPDVITSLNLASGGYVNYEVAEIHQSNLFPTHQNGHTYSEATYNECYDDPEHASCVKSDFNFQTMFGAYGICNKLNNGTIHEVMIFGAPFFQTDEFAFKIPNDRMPYDQPTNSSLYDIRKKNIPDCGKTVFVMGYTYENALDNAMHVYSHRIESALSLTVGRGYWDGCIGHNGVASDFDKFTCIKRNITETTPVQTPGPGNTHDPANAVDGDYDNEGDVTHNGPSWQNYPFTTETTVTEDCHAWGCEQGGYMQWLLGKLPKKDGVTPNGNLKNWWKYIVDYDAALSELGIVTCAADYAQSNCLSYVQGTIVSSGGHNWRCSNGNCANCATYPSCTPGATGCPWGTVWTDQGTCH